MPNIETSNLQTSGVFEEGSDHHSLGFFLKFLLVGPMLTKFLSTMIMWLMRIIFKSPPPSLGLASDTPLIPIQYLP